jgi:glutaredoxin
MKAISLLITLSFLLSLGIGVFSQETELPDPGLTPDSPFYFLEIISEEIITFFTFGDIKKAERYVTLAAERLVEAQVIAGKGKPELVEKTLQRYKNQLNNSIIKAEKAQTKGENIEEVMTRVSEVTSRHLEVLAEVYEKVPEQAKPAIENAMEVSLKGYKKAVEVLKEKGVLGEVPEEVSLPTQVPQEVRERVQTRVQQQLEIEKVFEGIDTSKSLRDICAEQGGTPEMCKEFPLEKFESFEQIEAFCKEKGGPPEICTSLESKCREFGVTTVNECFLFLSISSIKTYQSVELKAIPMPSLSEKRLKQRYTPGVSNVIIYLTSTCPHCVMAKEWFQKNNIQYEEFDISQDEIKQNELMKKVGRLVVPIIEVEGDIMVGFNEERFSELFGIGQNIQ